MKKLKKTMKKAISLILVIFVLSASSPWYVIAQELKTDNGIQQVEQTEGDFVDSGSQGESADGIGKGTTENKKTESSKDNQQIEGDNIAEEGSTGDKDLIQNSNEKTNEQAEGSVSLSEINQVMNEENVEEVEGFKIALRWAKSSNSDMEWHATKSEKKVMKLTFYYQNEVAKKTYEQNEIKVTIPGIGKLNRSGAIKASDIAADVYGTKVFKRDWSYQYDSASDTYTFYNNKTIEEGSTFNGSFEMIWEFSSRDCINDYKQEIKATLRAKDDEMVESSPLNLHFTSDPDTYTITKKAQAVTSADGLSKFVEEGKNVSDYAWVRYTFTCGVKETKARGLRSKRIVDTFPEDCVIASNSSNVSKDKDGNWCYTINDSSTSGTYSVIVGYPADKYMNEENKKIENTAYLYGVYNDEKNDKEEQLATSKVDVLLEEIKEQVVGVVPDKYISPSNVYKDNLTGNLSFTTTLQASATAEGNKQYKLVIADDYLELETQEAGTEENEKVTTCKQLKKDEYQFTSVTIPGKNNCTNQNGYTLSDGEYNVKISVLYADEVNDDEPETWILDNYEEIYEGEWENQSKKIDIEKKAVAIRVEISGLTESVNNFSVIAGLTINISKHIDENPTHIINYDYTDLLDNGGNSLIGDIKGKDYSLNTGLSERDNNVYKKGMLRDNAVVNIIERKVEPGTYSAESDIEPFMVDENIEYFTTKLHHSTTVNNKYSEEIKEIEVYGITERDELETLIETLQLTHKGLKFKNELSSDVDMIDYLKERATIEKNGKEISIKFNFSDNPVVSTNFSIGFTVDARINYEQYYDTADPTYRITTNSYIDKEILKPTTTTTYKDETMATRSDSQSILLALASHQQIIKLVKTKYSGDFVQDNAVAPMGSEYTYRLKLRNGYNTLENTKIMDILEHAELTKLEDGKKYEKSEWYGTFQNVDTSYIEARELKPTVQYATETEINDQTQWLEMQEDDNHKWTPKNGEDVKNVKAIKVEIEGEIAENSIVYVDVNMQAPNEEENKNKHTYNSYTINCDAKDLYTGEKSSFMKDMPSNMVDVRLVKKAYNVIITKSDAKTKNKLSGVEFEIYQEKDGMEEEKPTYKTGILGNIVITSLSEGTYKIREKNPLAGYEAIGDYTLTIENEKYTLTDDKGNKKEENIDISQSVPTININIENNRAKGSITIHKIDEYAQPMTDEELSGEEQSEANEESGEEEKTNKKGKEIPLAGVTFDLKKVSGELIKEVTTDSDGNAKFEDLEWGEVYVIVEKNTLQGYELALEQNTYLSRLDINKTVTIENKRKTGSVTLTKQDEQNEETKIQGATYGLFAKENIYGKDGSILYTEGKQIESAETDEQGRVTFDDLIWGKYFIKETKTVYGYELSEEEHEFEISAEIVEKIIDEPIQKTEKEVRSKAKLQLVKIDENGTVLPGAEFELFKKDGTKVPKMNGETGEEEPYVTDDRGYLNIENIEWGEYYIQETKSPQGYEQNDTKYYFTVDRETFATGNNTVTSVKPEKAKDENTSSEGTEPKSTNSENSESADTQSEDTNEPITSEETEKQEEKISIIKNKRKTGKVILTKYATDEKGTEEKETILPGAVYDLYLADGTLIRTETTTEEGKIKIENLDWGSYYFQEKQAPDGYSISEQKIAFVINSENVDFEQELSAYDKPQTGEIKINKTISANSIYNAHGNSTFIFKIVGKDEKGEVKVELYKAITFTEQDLKNCVEGGNITKTITISDVEAYIYEITEEENYRYELSEVTPVTENARVDEKDSKKGIVDFTQKTEETTETNTQNQTDEAATQAEETEGTVESQAKKGEITFKNNKQNNSLLTDNGLITNSAQSQYYLIGISAQPNQESYTVGKALKKEDFTYTLYYSGGQKEEKETLIEGEITFNGRSEYTADNAGDYLVEIEYTLNGKTYKTTVATKWVMPDDFFKFNLLNSTDKTIAITGIDSKYISPEVLYIPGEYNGYKVTQINTLSNINNVIIIDIAEGIERLNASFANNIKLEEIHFPSTLTSISYRAFEQCSKLKYLDLSNTQVSSISNGWKIRDGYVKGLCYYCTSLEEVKLPNTLESIGSGAFSNCSKLKKVNLDNTQVTSIGEAAFYRSGLMDIQLPNTVSKIDIYAFSLCGSLSSINLSETQVTSMGDYVFENCSSLTSINIPESVTSIGNHAFTNCRNLTSINIPESVTSIGDDAFYSCNSLTSTNIPESVTSIGDNAFYICSSLTSITVSEENENYSDLDGILYDKGKSVLIKYPEGKKDKTVYNIPESVISIKDYACYRCSSLTSINVPEGVTSIGNYAFGGCSSLTSINVPKGVTNIGNDAFSGCSSLTSINVPEGITSIGNYVFSGCSSLTSINVPEGVTSIGNYAFYRCSSFTSIKLPSSVTSIGNSAFYGCSRLTNINIPESVTSIGNATFRECSRLTSINIPEGVTSIENQVFCSCSGLTSIELPSSVTSIGDSAFYECRGLKTINYHGTEEQFDQIRVGSGNTPFTKDKVKYINDNNP